MVFPELSDGKGIVDVTRAMLRGGAGQTSAMMDNYGVQASPFGRGRMFEIDERPLLFGDVDAL